MYYRSATLDCGCEIEYDMSVYMDGCCELCYSAEAEFTGGRISNPCAEHS